MEGGGGACTSLRYSAFKAWNTGTIIRAMCWQMPCDVRVHEHRGDNGQKRAKRHQNRRVYVFVSRNGRSETWKNARQPGVLSARLTASYIAAANSATTVQISGKKEKTADQHICASSDSSSSSPSSSESESGPFCSSAALAPAAPAAAAAAEPALLVAAAAPRRPGRVIRLGPDPPPLLAGGMTPTCVPCWRSRRCGHCLRQHEEQRSTGGRTQQGGLPAPCVCCPACSLSRVVRVAWRSIRLRDEKLAHFGKMKPL